MIDVMSITPIKTITAANRKSDTYRRIAASIASVGLIEPLIVFPTGTGSYLLLDGNTRLDVLVETRAQVAKCLLATDNESYTYNKRVNYIPPIAQHHMILRALAHVSEDRIASALNVSVAAIRQKRDLLTGICPEAAEILRNERVTVAAFSALRKMKPIRQINVARVMIGSKKFSGRFARALLAATNDDLLVAPPSPREKLLETDQQSVIEQETSEMLRHADSIKANYGNDVLELTAACGYVQQLLSNQRVHRYLAKHHGGTAGVLKQLLDEVAAEKQRRPVKASKSPRSGTVSEPNAKTA